METGGNGSRETFTTSEVAGYCHVSPNTVGRWLDGGKLAHFRTAGGHRRVYREDLLAFMAGLGIRPPEALARGRLRVLLVEDDAPVRRVLRKLIARAAPDALIEEAGDGFEAGRRIAAQAPSLLVLDIFLPGVDGVELCRRLRADPKTSSMRILAVSGQDAERTRGRALAAGADVFLAKPMDMAAFVSKARELLAAAGAGLP